MTAMDSLRAYGDGKIGYDQLVADFRAMPMAVQKPAASVAECFATADEYNDGDIPGALDAASYAGIIDDRQERELLDIYRSKV